MSEVIKGLSFEIDLSGDADEELKAWIKSLAEARGLTGSAAADFNRFEKEMIDSARSIGLSKEQLKELATQAKRTEAVSDFSKKYGVSMSEIAEKTKAAKTEVLSFASAAQAALAGGVVSSLFGAAKGAVSLAADYEATAMGFEVMLHSADKAKQMLKELDKFSNVTPYEPKEVNDSARALLAMGIQAKDIIPTLQRVGDVAAVAQMPINDLALMYGKNFSSGIVQMDDLNQISARGIPIMKLLSKQFFGNDEQVMKVRELSSKGKISFKDLEKAFITMTSSGGDAFKAMEKLSGTAIGKWSTLKGNFDNVKRSVGEMLMNALAPLTDWLIKGTTYLIGNKNAMFAFKLVILAIVPVIGVLLVGAMSAATKATLKMALATLKAAGPYMLIAAVIIGVILIIEDLYVAITGGESVLGEWLGKFIDFKVVNEIIDSISGAIFDFILFVDRNFTYLATVIGVVLSPLIPLFLLMAWNFATMAVSAVINFGITAVSAVISFGAMAIAVIAATWPFILFVGVVALVVAIIFDLYDAFTGGDSVIANALSAMWEKIKKFFTWVWNGITEIVSSVWGALVEFGTAIVDVITWPYRKAYELIKEALGAVWDFLFGDQDAKEIKVSGSVSSQKVAGARAMGGPVSAGQTYLVGENGPEFFTPGRDGAIIPGAPSKGSGSAAGGSGQVVISTTLNFNSPVSREDGSFIKAMVEEAISRVVGEKLIQVRLGVGLEA